MKTNIAKFLSRGKAEILDLLLLYVVMINLPREYRESIFIIGIIYFVILPILPWRGTLGKISGKIQIFDKDGNKLSIWRSLFRFIIKYLPYHILLIGALVSQVHEQWPYYSDNYFIYDHMFLMLQLLWFVPAIFRKDGRAIHDIICGTMVVEVENPKYWRISLWLKYLGQKIQINAISKVIFIAVVGVIIFATITSFEDATLTENYKEMVGFGDNEVIWEDNALIADAGFTAPADVEDYYEYGRQEIHNEKRQRAYEIQEYKHFSTIDIISSLYFTDAALEEEVELESSETPDTIQWLDFINPKLVHKNIYDCWRRNAPEPEKDCPADEIIQKLAQDNAILLKRYEDLITYGNMNSKGLRASAYYSWSEIISVARLDAMLLIFEAKKNPEQAFDKWLARYGFWKMALNDRQDLVGKSIMTVIHNIYLRKLLFALLEGYPEMVKKNADKLRTALKPFGPEAYNVADVLKSEYQGFHKFFEVLGVKAVNDLNKLYQQFFDLSMMDYTEFMDKRQVFESEYNSYSFKVDYILRPLRSTIQELIFAGLSVATDMFDNWHFSKASMTLINLYIEVIVNDIPNNKIADYAKERTDLYNHMTGKPFEYDPATNSLYQTIIDDFRINLYFNDDKI